MLHLLSWYKKLPFSSWTILIFPRFAPFPPCTAWWGLYKHEGTWDMICGMDYLPANPSNHSSHQRPSTTLKNQKILTAPSPWSAHHPFKKKKQWKEREKVSSHEWSVCPGVVSAALESLKCFLQTPRVSTLHYSAWKTEIEMESQLPSPLSNAKISLVLLD